MAATQTTNVSTVSLTLVILQLANVDYISHRDIIVFSQNRIGLDSAD